MNDSLATLRASAVAARLASRTLTPLPFANRQAVVLAIAKTLQHPQNSEWLLNENARDVEQMHTDAFLNNKYEAMKKRLTLTREKIKVLVDGMIQLATQTVDPIGKVLRRTEISEKLYLTHITVPIGVLLVIFEARADVYPQLVALAVLAGNAIMLKGGKEIKHTIDAFHKITMEAIAKVMEGKVRGEELVVLLSDRNEVEQVLKLDDVIDLVIPRGGNALVRYIQNNTKIPVMGHAEGICHVYVDKEADIGKAISIVIDSKVDYPAACNAMETLLIHDCFVGAETLLNALHAANVKVNAGPRAALRFDLPMANDLHHEYGDLECTVELVSTLEEAIEHIHRYGSAHTDSIVTENLKNAETFQANVDSACVFVNSSTRFADGYRFGLGAEVGISTGRIHARGPVALDGLTTTKWLLTSTCSNGSTVQQFTKKEAAYTHRPLPLNSNDC